MLLPCSGLKIKSSLEKVVWILQAFLNFSLKNSMPNSICRLYISVDKKGTSCRSILVCSIWKRYSPPKLRETSTRLHGITPQKIVFVIVTAVRT
jgi:hypothetical protein